VGVCPHMAVEVQRVADAVEALALHDFGTCGGEEALVFAGIGAVEEIGDHVVDDGVAQELQPLVIGPTAVSKLDRPRAMDHRQLIELDVAGIVTRDAVNKNIKLLILDEKELYE